MIWNDYLAEMRADIQDTGTTPRWTDKMLYVYTKDAIRDYSTWFPLRTDRKVMTLSTDGLSYPLPADYIEDICVECPQDRYLEKRPNRPGTLYRKTGFSFSYYTSGGNLYISSPAAAGDNVLLTYYSCHPIPASEVDSTFAFTVPDSDIELIRIYTKAMLYQQMRSKQAALDRFKLGTGKRDDNPLMPEVGDLMEYYYHMIAQRSPGGVIVLYRTGRPR